MERLKTLDLAKEELDIILDQLNEIELKCQAFLLMDPTETAEERAMHARRVKDCLEEE